MALFSVSCVMRHHAPPPRLVSGRRVAVVFLSRLDAQHAHTLKPQTASMKQQRWNSTNNDICGTEACGALKNLMPTLTMTNHEHSSSFIIRPTTAAAAVGGGSYYSSSSDSQRKYQRFAHCTQYCCPNVNFRCRIS